MGANHATRYGCCSGLDGDLQARVLLCTSRHCEQGAGATALVGIARSGRHMGGSRLDKAASTLCYSDGARMAPSLLQKHQTLPQSNLDSKLQPLTRRKWIRYGNVCLAALASPFLLQDGHPGFLLEILRYACEVSASGPYTRAHRHGF